MVGGVKAFYAVLLALVLGVGCGKEEKEEPFRSVIETGGHKIVISTPISEETRSAHRSKQLMGLLLFILVAAVIATVGAKTMCSGSKVRGCFLKTWVWLFPAAIVFMMISGPCIDGSLKKEGSGKNGKQEKTTPKGSSTSGPDKQVPALKTE